ncbi:hypothetical protein ACT3QR_02490 [Psychrobacter sp. AOP7-B1-25]|uniref:hypothetical protein n=1 Tax=Psychrobacter sp. AOP7-B1-25 TaxID=3457644 RepID=UPI00402B874C
MKNLNMKKIAISSLLAVSTCFAMIGPANAAQQVVVVKDKHQAKKVVVKAKPQAKKVVVAKDKSPAKKVVVVKSR